MERRERKAGAKGSAVVLWYSQAIDALRLLPGVLQQYLKMKSSFPSIQEGICSVKRSWYHDVMQDVTSNSSDDIIAITCTVPSRSWGWLAVEGAAIIPAMMITTTTEPLSEVFVALWKWRNVNRESSLGKTDAFKRLPQDSYADKVSFGCLWGICLGRTDPRTSRHSQRTNSPSCTCYNNKLKSALTVMMLLSVSEMSNGSSLMAFLPLCLCWEFWGEMPLWFQRAHWFAAICSCLLTDRAPFLLPSLFISLQRVFSYRCVILSSCDQNTTAFRFKMALVLCCAAPKLHFKHLTWHLNIFFSLLQLKIIVGQVSNSTKVHQILCQSRK